MAEETVNYRAKSILLSKTMWVNLALAIVGFVGSDAFKQALGPTAPEWYVLMMGIVNMVLRYLTVRPVALVTIGESKPVAVDKLA